MPAWNGFHWEFHEAEMNLIDPPLCGREEMKTACPVVGCGRRMKLTGAFANAVYFGCPDCLVSFTRYRSLNGKWWGEFVSGYFR